MTAHAPYDWQSDQHSHNQVLQAGITPDWMCEAGGCVQPRDGEKHCARHADRRKLSQPADKISPQPKMWGRPAATPDDPAIIRHHRRTAP